MEGEGRTMEKVKIKTIGSYNGHSVKNNKIVSLNLKFNYDELSNYIQLCATLNNDVDIKVKIEGTPYNIGSFRIQKLLVEHDGVGKITFNSTLDYAELANITELIDTERFNVLFYSEVEEDTEDGEE